MTGLGAPTAMGEYPHDPEPTKERFDVFPQSGDLRFGPMVCWSEEEAKEACAKFEPEFGTMFARTGGYLVEYRDGDFIGAGQDDEVRT